MGPHVPEESPEVSITWTKGKWMESSPNLSSWNGGIKSNNPGRLTPGYIRKFARSYRARLNNGKHGEKALSKSDTHSEITAASNVSSDSGGVVTAFLDSENTDAESMKSPTSSSSDPAELVLKTQLMETLIANIFSTISNLKSAYTQLQSAHVTYDPNNLQIADKAVIAELKHLSELKHSYEERLAIISCAEVQELPDVPKEANVEKAGVLLKSYEGIISNFHIEIQKKNAIVENLKDMLAHTTLRKEKLEQRVKWLEERLARDPLANSPADLLPTLQLLEYAVLGASEASRIFTELLTSLMKVAHWDLDAAANSIEQGMTYIRGTHQKFAFESYVNHRMLKGFESENFFVTSNISTVMDPEKNSQECFKEFRELRLAEPLVMVTENPQSMFSKYCLKKFLDVIHPQMEESFFGNLEHRKQVLTGCHPTSQFYQSFLKLAKATWLLQRLAFSFEPNARIFHVQREVDFSPLYMESIVQLREQDANNHCATLKVGFTVMPGFRLEKKVIKCQVYLMGTPNIEAPE